MFTKEMPKTISKMYDVVYRADEILGKTFRVEKRTAPGEYDLFFETKNREKILFAGFRFSLYQCARNWFWLGVAMDWNRKVVDAFRENHGDEVIRFENFFLCPLPAAVFEKENYIDEAVSIIEKELNALAAVL